MGSKSETPIPSIFDRPAGIDKRLGKFLQECLPPDCKPDLLLGDWWDRYNTVTIPLLGANKWANLVLKTAKESSTRKEIEEALETSRSALLEDIEACLKIVIPFLLWWMVDDGEEPLMEKMVEKMLSEITPVNLHALRDFLLLVTDGDYDEDGVNGHDGEKEAASKRDKGKAPMRANQGAALKHHQPRSSSPVSESFSNSQPEEDSNKRVSDEEESEDEEEEEPESKAESESEDGETSTAYSGSEDGGRASGSKGTPPAAARNSPRRC